MTYTRRPGGVVDRLAGALADGIGWVVGTMICGLWLVLEVADGQRV